MSLWYNLIMDKIIADKIDENVEAFEAGIITLEECAVMHKALWDVAKKLGIMEAVNRRMPRLFPDNAW